MPSILTSMMSTFERGGPVMWPLLVLSVISIAMSIERSAYWLRANLGGRTRWIDAAVSLLGNGDLAGAKRMADGDRTIYGRIMRTIIDAPEGDSIAVETAERHRGSFERFGASLMTIVTAAPLLGILGTVLGIIKSFDLLGQAEQVADVSQVAVGIAQALITTAFGLVVALITLFPYMLFRTQAERILGSIELLSAARMAAPRRKPSIPDAHR